MHNIHYYVSNSDDVPGNNDWLSDNEKEILVNLRFLKRRQEWRLGRWTAKNAFLLFKAAVDNIPLSEIEILAKKSGAPYLFMEKEKSSLVLSISHRAAKAVCILSNASQAIGCDLEIIETRSDQFINDYLSDNERLVIEHSQGKHKALLANLIWSAKESCLKALELGLNMDTRDIDISDIETGKEPSWKNLKVTVKNSTHFYGAWIRLDNYILTVVSKNRFKVPIKILN